MDARDHPVELSQQRVLVIGRAVGQDVDLAPREQPDPPDPRVRLVHELDLPAQLVRRDVVAKAVRGRVVGNREVIEALRTRGEGHLLDAPVPVRGRRVRVQVAPEIRQLDQFWQRARRCRLEFAAILAQLRRDVGEAGQGVDLGLARAVVGDAGGVVEHTVFGEVQTRAHGALAQRRVVRV